MWVGWAPGRPRRGSTATANLLPFKGLEDGSRPAQTSILHERHRNDHILHNLCGPFGYSCENFWVVKAAEKMAASQKKVVVRRTDGRVAWGYLPQSGLLHQDQVALMGVDGRVNTIAFREIQMISYVRDFNLDDPLDPERLGRRSFAGRPRGEGLWVRLGFQDDSLLEGLMPLDLRFLETVLEDQGVFLTPPDGRSNVLQVFVPRR